MKQNILQKIIATSQIIILLIIAPFIWLYYTTAYALDFAGVTFKAACFQTWCIWNGVQVEDGENELDHEK